MERTVLHQLLHLPDKVFKGFLSHAIRDLCGVHFVSLRGVEVASKLRVFDSCKDLIFEWHDRLCNALNIGQCGELPPGLLASNLWDSPAIVYSLLQHRAKYSSVYISSFEQAVCAGGAGCGGDGGSAGGGIFRQRLAYESLVGDAYATCELEALLRIRL
eukprot:12278910-Karenia_brevis.AAC.1